MSTERSVGHDDGWLSVSVCVCRAHRCARGVWSLQRRPRLEPPRKSVLRVLCYMYGDPRVSPCGNRKRPQHVKSETPPGCLTRASRTRSTPRAYRTVFVHMRRSGPRTSLLIELCECVPLVCPLCTRKGIRTVTPHALPFASTSACSVARSGPAKARAAFTRA